MNATGVPGYGDQEAPFKGGAAMPEGSSRLAGKVAFITGAGRGQGRAHAVRMASEGADVIVTDACADVPCLTYRLATRDELDETARLVEKQGRRVVATVADVRDYDALSAALRAGVAELGRLDIVIANAGILTSAPFWELTTEQWRDTIDVNLTGMFHTLKAATPILIEQGEGGSIIAVSSTGGLRGLPFIGAYNASKHGVVGLVKTLANEVAQYNIRVNTIHPTGVMTEIATESVLQGLVQEHAATLGPIFMNAMPDPPMMQPEDVTGAVAWLASDDAKYVTGAQIPVDMGTLLR
jgi:SDR family mycofactocin-dependent oxidoreductase